MSLGFGTGDEGAGCCMLRSEQMDFTSGSYEESAIVRPLDASRNADIHRAYCSSYIDISHVWMWMKYLYIYIYIKIFHSHSYIKLENQRNVWKRMLVHLFHWKRMLVHLFQTERTMKCNTGTTETGQIYTMWAGNKQTKTNTVICKHITKQCALAQAPVQVKHRKLRPRKGPWQRHWNALVAILGSFGQCDQDAGLARYRTTSIIWLNNNIEQGFP